MKIFFIIIVILILAGGGVLFYSASQKTTPATDRSPHQDVVPDQKFSDGQKNSETSSWKVFQDRRYSFQFRYPVNWSVGNQQDNIRVLILKDEDRSEVVTVDTGVDLTVFGISYCEAYPQDNRCETLETESGDFVTIDWDVSGKAYALLSSQDGISGVLFTLHTIDADTKIIFKKILSTFQDTRKSQGFQKNKVPKNPSELCSLVRHAHQATVSGEGV